MQDLKSLRIFLVWILTICKILLLLALLLPLVVCLRSRPSDSQGDQSSTIDSSWSQEKLDAAATYAEEIGSAAVLVLHDGQVVFSYGNTSRKHMCHSIRKPFLGTLYGIYVERGHIKLNVTLADLNIDDIPLLLTDTEKQATVRDLLMSRSGVYHEAAEEIQVMRDIRPQRGSHAPGRFFYYN